MFCAIHKERIAIATCACCDRGICADCQTIVKGQYFCRSCAAAVEPGSQSSRYRHPLIAALLSLVIPGLGQIYNGQVSKGVAIFLSFWLVVPWIYGIFDAAIVAKKINKGELAVRPSTGCLIGCVVLLLFAAVSPFVLLKAVQYYTLLSQIDAEETLAINTLLKISDAAENYAKDKSRYPENFSELYFSVPPYIKEIHCDVTVAGYQYGCVFSKKGYLITAKPESNAFGGRTTFSITTGGALVPFDTAELLEMERPDPMELEMRDPEFGDLELPID